MGAEPYTDDELAGIRATRDALQAGHMVGMPCLPNDSFRWLATLDAEQAKAGRVMKDYLVEIERERAALDMPPDPAPRDVAEAAWNHGYCVGLNTPNPPADESEREAGIAEALAQHGQADVRRAREAFYEAAREKYLASDARFQEGDELIDDDRCADVFGPREARYKAARDALKEAGAVMLAAEAAQGGGDTLPGEE